MVGARGKFLLFGSPKRSKIPFRARFKNLIPKIDRQCLQQQQTLKLQVFTKRPYYKEIKELLIIFVIHLI